MMGLQEKMQGVLEAAVAGGRERGVQLAVYHKGKLVVDAWAGVANAETGEKVRGETLFPVFSVGKGMTSTVMHIMAERYKLSYDMPLAEVWPEFGGQGKRAITLRQVLAHTAGMAYMPAGTTLEQVHDWKTMCGILAGMAPATQPGSEMLYHAVTFGWLAGEVACRLTGKRFGELLEEEICRPLRISTMFMGIPAGVDLPRAVLEEVFEEAAASAADPTTQAPKGETVTASMMPLHGWMNRADTQGACVPASNGMANARAVARHYAALMPGGIDGVELLSEKRLEMAMVQQKPSGGQDPLPLCVGLGYQLGSPMDVKGAPRTSLSHGGYGGAAGFGIRGERLAVGLTKNLFSKAGAQEEIFKALRAALG